MRYDPNAKNLAAERYQKRYGELSPEIQRELDAMDNWDWREHQLLKLKKSRVAPKEGDLFVFSPKEGVYFMGRVICEKIDHITQDTFVHGKSVVFLYRIKGKTNNRANFRIDYDKLLVPPMIVDASYWRQGLFETIGNEPLSEMEKQLDYGFFSVAKKYFCRADGTVLTCEPKHWGVYGISTIIAVAMEYSTEAIIDPSLA